MKNALKIGSVRRISIYLHWTFLLLVVGIFALYLYQGVGIDGALAGVGLILALFACVVAHELGHALTAARYDVPTRDITIYPIGGVARLQRIPEEPVKELWIALAGPAVNLVIALVLFALLAVRGSDLSPEILLRPGQDFVSTLAWMNAVLVGFNLLPAFPMDGGRVLRALLAMRMDYTRATEIAANVGQGMAILFGFVGLVVVFNPVLLFIALFVYIGAQQEAKQALMRSLTQGLSVREAMMTRFRTLTPDQTLGDAVAELLAGSDQDFPVVQDGAVVGVLTRKRLMKALAELDRNTRVADVAETGCLTIDSDTMLAEAFARMQEASCSSAPVLRSDRLVGLLTLENVGELLMVSSALRKDDRPRRSDAAAEDLVGRP